MARPNGREQTFTADGEFVVAADGDVLAEGTYTATSTTIELVPGSGAIRLWPGRHLREGDRGRHADLHRRRRPVHGATGRSRRWVQPNHDGFAVVTHPDSRGPGDRDVVFIRTTALASPTG